MRRGREWHAGTWKVGAAACVVAAGWAASAWGQGTPAPVAAPTETPTEQPAGQAGGQPSSASALAHPAAAISARMAALRASQRVHDVVVIVPDARSYVEAIALWRPDELTPVLIDDGTDAAREDIARFVRAFKPSRVRTWVAGGAASDSAAGESAGAGEDADAAVVPAPVRFAPNAASFATVEGASLHGALARVIGITKEAAPDAPPMDLARILAGWKANQYAPPGLVVAHPSDPAWTAALALAAGRGQALAFLDALPTNKSFGQTLSGEELEALARAIDGLVQQLGDIPWQEQGDVVDAVTLCLNVPVKYAISDRENLATSDLIGRHDTRRQFSRWAWSGQVPGTAAQAAYRAMCALFLQPTDAWLFDGYKPEGPFAAYDASAAAIPLRAQSITTRVDDTPNGTIAQWRARVARPIGAGLILVNTSGNADFFDLAQGRGRPGDVPVLAMPAFAHVIHSWSLERPVDRGTLGARWLERGAFAYVGSVNEPFLAAFLPPVAITRAAAAGMIMGAAVRVDARPPWKVAYIGDPLFALGPAQARMAAPSPHESMPGIGDPAAGLRQAMLDARWADALDALRVTGRDGDGVKLVQGILARSGAQVAADTVAVAPLDARATRIALSMLFRTGDARGVVALARRASPEALADPVARDVVWLASLPLISAGGDPALLALLREIPREDQLVRDIGAVAAAEMRRADFASALAMLRAWRAGARPQLQEAIDAVIAQRPEAWGEE